MVYNPILAKFHEFGDMCDMAKQDDYIRYTIRVPARLYGRLQNAAGEKSINAEVNERLEQSLAVPFRIRPEHLQSLAQASDAEIAEFQEGLDDLLDAIFPKAVLLIRPEDHWRQTMEVYAQLPEGPLREKWRMDTLNVCRLLAKDPNWEPPEDAM